MTAMKWIAILLAVLVAGYIVFLQVTVPSDVREENCEVAPQAFDYC